MHVQTLLTLTPACSGEEPIPAKKTKTLVSQMHQTEVEQVGHTSKHSRAPVKALVAGQLLVSSLSEDGDQLPHRHHDEGPSGGGRTGSQSTPTSFSQTNFQVPHPAGGQGGSRTPAVAVASQTREGPHAHNSQVRRYQRGTFSSRRSHFHSVAPPSGQLLAPTSCHHGNREAI